MCKVNQNYTAGAQGPHSQILMTGVGEGGGSDRGSYFILKKITTSELFCLPKKITTFLAYPQNSLSPFLQRQNISSVFFTTQKNPGIFHRPPPAPRH